MRNRIAISAVNNESLYCEIVPFSYSATGIFYYLKLYIYNKNYIRT